MLPQELVDVKKRLQEAAGELQKTVSLEHILKIAGEASELEACGLISLESKNSVSECPIIAVARDEAFCFYYEDNLRLLQEYGAKLKFFSPIHDEGLPEGSCGILLGGGYPELYGVELSSNRNMLSSIKEAMERGIPVVAECGGFMYLHNKIIDKENQSYPMVGAIDAECHYTGRLVRFGYIELQEKDANFLPEGEMIRGHEFHYFDSQQNGENSIATKPVTGRKYPCVISKENCWMGFPHLYYPSNPVFAKNFVEKAKNYKLKKIRR